MAYYNFSISYRVQRAQSFIKEHQANPFWIALCNSGVYPNVYSPVNSYLPGLIGIIPVSTCALVYPKDSTVSVPKSLEGTYEFKNLYNVNGYNFIETSKKNFLELTEMRAHYVIVKGLIGSEIPELLVPIDMTGLITDVKYVTGFTPPPQSNTIFIKESSILDYQLVMSTVFEPRQYTGSVSKHIHFIMEF